MGWTNIRKKAEADELTNLEKSIDSESAHSSKKTVGKENPTHELF
jgi:hypothetical protein